MPPEGLAASLYGTAVLLGGGFLLGTIGGDDLGLRPLGLEGGNGVASALARRLSDPTPSLVPALALVIGALGLTLGDVFALDPGVTLVLSLFGGAVTALIVVVAASGKARARAVRDGLLLAGLLFTIFAFTVVLAINRRFAFDAFAYWSVDLGDLYGRSHGTLVGVGGFYYPPPAAQVLGLFGGLPFSHFVLLYEACLLAILLWLGGRAALVLMALPIVAVELYLANVHLLLAGAIVLGFRFPVAWVFVLLTKVSPGIGLIWFAARREWPKLAVATGGTGAVAVLSWITAPGLWGDWVAMLVGNAATSVPFTIPPPLPVRLALAALFVLWGARTDRAWTVPVGAAMALPVLWPHGLTVALGALPLLRRTPPPMAEAAETRSVPGVPRLRDLAALLVSAGVLAAAVALLAGQTLTVFVDGVTANYR